MGVPPGRELADLVHEVNGERMGLFGGHSAFESPAVAALIPQCDGASELLRSPDDERPRCVGELRLIDGQCEVRQGDAKGAHVPLRAGVTVWRRINSSGGRC